jgi:DNA-binding MarR family transcriptional regulator
MRTANVSSPPKSSAMSASHQSVEIASSCSLAANRGQDMNVETNTLLRAILGMTARQAISVESLLQLVAPKAGSEAQIEAYNKCDGNHTQGQIAKEIGLDSGNFSRTVSRWVEAGIVMKRGDSREPILLHIYPIPKDRIGKERGR